MTAARKRKPQPDLEMEYLATADLSRYKGKYVAIVDRCVAAAGKDPRVVLAKAKKRFPDRQPLLWKVPTEDLLIL